MTATLINGDARHIPLADCSVQCVVTSPPYFGLRDYGTAQWEGGDPECDHITGRVARTFTDASGKQITNAGAMMNETRGTCPKCSAVRVDRQIGLEQTPDEYVAQLVDVFREIWRVLREDGTAWLNIGDSYANDAKWGGATGGKHVADLHGNTGVGRTRRTTGLKPKDLCLIPARVALALQADGWWVRNEIIWHKPSCMPESVTDRCTRSHETIWLLTKSAHYYFDVEAIKEPARESSIARLQRGVSDTHKNTEGAPGQTPQALHEPRANVRFGGNRGTTRLHSGKAWEPSMGGGGTSMPGHSGNVSGNGTVYVTAQKRDVWTVANPGFDKAHFATFPPKLIEPCILAGSKPGDVVLDPFAGSGTTGVVAIEHGRSFVGVELNPAYIELAQERLTVTPRLILEAASAGCPT